MRRALLTCAAALAAAGALAAPAAADQPQRVAQTIVVDQPQVVTQCPNGLPVLQTYTIQRILTTFTDASGDVTRMVRHATIQGTRYTSDLSRSVPFGARIHVVDDYVKGIHTVSGQRSIVNLPGPDERTAGRAVFDLATGELLKETGLIATDEQICRYLYG